jgi:Bacterial PH domain
MKAATRTVHPDDHEFEPQYGLPEVLPAGEKLLWQGSPDWRAMAIEVFHVRKLAIYFAALLVLRAAFVLADGGSVLAALASLSWLAVTAAVALTIMVALARLAASTAVYSITDRRVTMRIGIVLTVTYNLPLKRIEGAGLLLRGTDGHGDIPITLRRGEQIAILQLWPHARPWHVARPQPMLRCLRDVREPGRVLTAAWSAANGAAVQQHGVEARASEGRPAANNDHAGLPKLAGSRAA